MTIAYQGTREAFSAALLDLAERDPRIVLVSSDSLKAMRATAFAQRFPERVYEVGIAEQNAVALAAGLASCGLIPYVGTYAGFITMRACEQLRTFVAYPGLNVRFVGANGGIYAGEREGVTHQFFEDLGIVRSIPGITIAAPCDAGQVFHATQAIAYVDGPAYLRVGSGREPEVLPRETPFELGRACVLAQHGQDVALFANGFVMSRVLKAGELLAAEGIGATVVDVHTLRPLDREGIARVLRAAGAAVTIEDHNINGALGSAIAEVACEECPTPLVRLGLQDVFPESGEAEAVLDAYGVSVGDIVQAAKRAIDKKTACCR